MMEKRGSPKREKRKSNKRDNNGGCLGIYLEKGCKRSRRV